MSDKLLLSNKFVTLSRVQRCNFFPNVVLTDVDFSWIAVKDEASASDLENICVYRIFALTISNTFKHIS